eukprot:CAMPEP_0202353218 /NCGR_PEP_ID=MMETSP1126-20121109/9076_1 /ASSEMBLY_ACC=CAM_ASM_000457 /TAXON_ID=3047 /ORGANISM="Dunaliella tertiolecta, Strain CCMP1320" /LENGTH=868 /DNA_ID=CAMNT_0048945541 /DNA_START=268 /DNA_END=2874 /DNA_ORIENTATION=-
MCPPNAFYSRLAEPTTNPACGPLLDTLQDIRHYSRRVVLYRGSISTVELAVHNPTGKQVVLKCYHKAKMQDKHYHKLDKEVRSMAALSGPYVAALYAWFSDDHHVWLVLEYCEGGDLFKAMANHGGRLDAHYVCVEVIAPLLRVLEKCSALNFIHRDIKPENLFLTKMFKLKLGDWGLATNCAEEIPFSRSGTLDYMSPEALRNPVTPLQEGPAVHPAVLAAKNIRPYTSKVDVWAAGVLAYELVVGKPPFEVESESQTAQLIMHSNTIPFPAQHCPLWADFVRTALIKDPEARPSAAQLMKHLWITSNLQAALRNASAAGRKSSKTTLLSALPLPPPDYLLPPHQICPPGFTPLPQPVGPHVASSVARATGFSLEASPPPPEQHTAAVPRTTIVARPQQPAKLSPQQGSIAAPDSSGRHVVCGLVGKAGSVSGLEGGGGAPRLGATPPHSSSHDVFMECFMAAQKNQTQQQQQQQQEAGSALCTPPVATPLWERRPPVGADTVAVSDSALCTPPGTPQKPAQLVSMPPTPANLPPKAPLVKQQQQQQQGGFGQGLAEAMQAVPHRNHHQQQQQQLWSSNGWASGMHTATTNTATGYMQQIRSGPAVAWPPQQQQNANQAPHQLGAGVAVCGKDAVSAANAPHPAMVPGTSPPRPTTPPRTQLDPRAPTLVATPPKATHPDPRAVTSHERELYKATQPDPRAPTLLTAPPKALTSLDFQQHVLPAGAGGGISSPLHSNLSLPRIHCGPWSPTRLAPAARSPLSRCSSASSASSRDRMSNGISVHTSSSSCSSLGSNSTGAGSSSVAMPLSMAAPWVHADPGAPLRSAADDSSGLVQGMAGLCVHHQAVATAKAAPAAYLGHRNSGWTA